MFCLFSSTRILSYYKVLTKKWVNYLSLWKTWIMRLKLTCNVIYILLKNSFLPFPFLFRQACSAVGGAILPTKDVRRNVFRFLKVMIWAEAVGLNPKKEFLEMPICCWQVLLQQSYFINLSVSEQRP